MIGLAWPCAGAVAQDYAQVKPGYELQFPRDHGSHPQFRTEWWYLTGWVKKADGTELGIQITFFRNRPLLDEANPSKFAPRQLLFAHAALADPAIGKLLHDQRAARAGFGLAEAKEGGTDVWIDDWSLQQTDSGYSARIAARDFGYALEFKPTQPLLLQGERGLSRKGPCACAGELLLQPAAARRVRHDHRQGRAVRGQRQRLARPRVVERIPGEGSRGLGLGGTESRRRRRADGVSHSRQERRHATGPAGACAAPTAACACSSRRR